MREAAIISTARTGLAKAIRGGFNKTHGITMGGHTVKHAIERAGIDAGEVEDIIFGCGQPEAAEPAQPHHDVQRAELALLV